MSVTIQYTDLSQQERSMLDAFRRGAAWNARYYRKWCKLECLTCDIPDPPKEAQAKDKDKAKAKDEAQDGAQHKDDYPLTVRGLVVRAAILGGVVDEAGLPVPIDDRGVRLDGVDIVGGFDLIGAHFCNPLLFLHCRFGGAVDFCDADLGYVSIEQCRLMLFSAERTGFQRGLALIRLRDCSFVGLRSAKIKKFLSLAGTTLSGAQSGDDMWALDCSDTVVSGNVFLNDKFVASGVVNFVGAIISGNLFCNGANLAYLDRPHDKKKEKEKRAGIQLPSHDAKYYGQCALYVHNARIGGSVYLTDGFRADGIVNFSMSHIGGNFNCRGAKIEGRRDPRQRIVALFCENIFIGAGLYLNDACCQGEVVFSTARVGAEMDCSMAEFRNDSCADAVMSCDNVTVGTDVFLRRLTALGCINFDSIRIGASLRAENCYIHSGKNGRALYCNGADIAESVFLDKANIFGQVNFVYAKVGGRFNCTDGQFVYDDRMGDEKHRAINGDSVVVAASVFLNSTHPSDNASLEEGRAGFSARGQVYLTNAKVRGDLKCMGGRFDNGDNASLVCSLARIDGSVVLTSGFAATGVVFFRKTVVNGHFYCRNGSFNDGLNERSSADNAAVRCALDLGSAHIDGVLYLTGVQSVVGELNLCDAFAHGLAEDGSTWNPNWRGGPRPSVGRRFLSWCVGGWRHVRLAIGRCVRRLRGRIPSILPEDGTVIAGESVSENGCVWTSSPKNGLPSAILRILVRCQRWCAKGYSFARHIPRALVRCFFRIWGPVDDGVRTCVIKLDHFIYDAFVVDERLSEDDGSPEKLGNGGGADGGQIANPQHGSKTDLSWQTRLAWLRAQPSLWLGTDFRPQPFTQCAKVLRAQGMERDANHILYEREKRRLQVRGTPIMTWLWGKMIYGPMFGFGYQVLQTLPWAAAIWLLGSVFFSAAYDMNIIIPRPVEVLASKEYQTNHAIPSGYPPFKAGLFSVDILIPFSAFSQSANWMPRDVSKPVDLYAVHPEWKDDPPIVGWSLFVGMMNFLLSSNFAKWWYLFQIAYGGFLSIAASVALAILPTRVKSD